MPEQIEKTLRILRFLSTGIVKWQRMLEQNHILYPYPDELLIGLDSLAVYCIENGMEYPTDISEAVRLFYTPIEQWNIFCNSRFFEEDQLLYDGMPTDFCYNLAITTGDVETELTEKLIIGVMDTCIAEGKPDDYVKFRRQIIEHPVISKHDIVSWSLDTGNCCAANFLKDAYEELPPYTKHNGKQYICGNCGWVLEWRNDIPHCDSHICSVMTNHFRNNQELVNSKGHIWRLKRGLLRFVTRPGLYEIRLESKLKKMGLGVEMWPNFDAYDLRITFPYGEIWAVDVKDWGNPYFLAKSVGDFREDPVWNRAFYVIPQYRKRSCSDYKQIFRETYNGSAKVDLEMENDFIRKVKQKLEKGVKE